MNWFKRLYSNKKRIILLAILFITACSPQTEPTTQQELNPAIVEPTPMSKVYDSLALTEGDGALGMYNYGGEHVYFFREDDKCEPTELADIGQHDMAIWNVATCSWDVIHRDDVVEIAGTWSSMLSPLTGNTEEVLIPNTSQDIAVDVALIMYDSTREYPLLIETHEGTVQRGWISFDTFSRREFYAKAHSEPLTQPAGGKIAVLGMITGEGETVHYFHEKGKCDPTSRPDIYSGDETLAVWDTQSCSWTYWHDNPEENMSNPCILGTSLDERNVYDTVANLPVDLSHYASCTGHGQQYRLLAYAFTNQHEPMLVVLQSNNRLMAMPVRDFFPCTFTTGGTC